MHYYKFDYNKVSNIGAKINKAQEDFNKNISTKVLMDYLKTSPSPVAQNMISMLEASVEEINSGYDSINSWCNDYANEAAELEKSLENKEIEPYTNELDNISRTIEDMTPVMGPIITEEDLNEPYIEEEYVYTDPDNKFNLYGLGSAIIATGETQAIAANSSYSLVAGATTGVADVGENILDSLAYHFSNFRATFGIDTAIKYSNASGEKFNEQKVNLEYEQQLLKDQKAAIDLINKNLADQLFDILIQDVEYNEENVTVVREEAKELSELVVITSLASISPALAFNFGYLRGSGEAANILFNNSDATINSAAPDIFMSGLVQGMEDFAVGKGTSDAVGGIINLSKIGKIASDKTLVDVKLSKFLKTDMFKKIKSSAIGAIGGTVTATDAHAGAVAIILDDLYKSYKEGEITIDTMATMVGEVAMSYGFEYIANISGEILKNIVDIEFKSIRNADSDLLFYNHVRNKLEMMHPLENLSKYTNDELKSLFPDEWELIENELGIDLLGLEDIKENQGDIFDQVDQEFRNESPEKVRDYDKVTVEEVLARSRKDTFVELLYDEKYGKGFFDKLTEEQQKLLINSISVQTSEFSERIIKSIVEFDDIIEPVDVVKNSLKETIQESVSGEVGYGFDNVDVSAEKSVSDDVDLETDDVNIPSTKDNVIKNVGLNKRMGNLTIN